MKLIWDEPPGICSQEDFDHDYKKVLNELHLLETLAKEKGYNIPKE